MNTIIKDDDLMGGATFSFFVADNPFSINKSEGKPCGEFVKILSNSWAWINDDLFSVDALKKDQTIRIMVKIPIPPNITLANYGDDIKAAFNASYRYPEIITPIYCEFDISEKFFSLTLDLDCRSADSETPKEIHFDYKT